MGDVESRESKEKSGVFCSHGHLRLSHRMGDSEAEGDSTDVGSCVIWRRRAVLAFSC